jgi:electron transfer flavoprotein alpha subunit
VLDDHTLQVTRETDSGFEVIECRLPALLTAAERLIKPVKTKPAILEDGQRLIAADPGLIETWDARDLGIPPEEAGLSGSPTWVAELRPVQIERRRLLLQGEALPSVRTLLSELEQAGLRATPVHRQQARPPLNEPIPHADTTKGVWAIGEILLETSNTFHVPGATYLSLRPITFELAGEAARLAALIGGTSVGVLLGSDLTNFHMFDLATSGANNLLVANDPRLNPYTPETHAWVLARAIQEYKPWAVLLPATSYGRDLAPRVAARLGLGLTGDCTGFELDDEGRLLMLKPSFGGQVVAAIVSRTLPAMATVRPGVLPMNESPPRPPFGVTHLNLDGLPAPRTRVLAVTHEGVEGLALDDARLVVCVGMGIGGPEALPEVRQLASELGEWMGLRPEEIAIGGTRKVVDEGWLPRHQQIGLTGRTVAPDLYLAMGLQGNFNHTSGILRSRTIVAVNTDPDAPIYLACDIGIIADWREFASALRQLLH